MKYIRIDDNLLHGSVAFSWVKNLKIHFIIIADNVVVQDEFLKMTLGISKPHGVHLKTLTIQDTLAFLHDQNNNKFNILVIVRSVKNASLIVTDIQEISTINIGMHRNINDVVFKCNSAYFDQNAYDECCKLNARGIDIEFRVRFDDPIIYFKDLLP